MHEMRSIMPSTYVLCCILLLHHSKKLEFWRKRGATVIVWTMAENEAQDFQKKFSVPVMVDIKP